MRIVENQGRNGGEKSPAVKSALERTTDWKVTGENKWKEVRY